MNDLYAVDGTSDPQPRGFDQLCSSTDTAPYSRYKVIGMKAKIKFMAPYASGYSGQIPIGWVQTHNVGDTATLPGKGYISLATNFATKGKFIPYYGKMMSEIELNAPSLHPFFNWTKEQFDVDMVTSTGTASASPSKRPSFEFALMDPTGGTAINCWAFVDIEYDVLFFGRNNLATS
jgi:hypothetical protein